MAHSCEMNGLVRRACFIFSLQSCTALDRSFYSEPCTMDDQQSLSSTADPFGFHRTKENRRNGSSFRLSRLSKHDEEEEEITFQESLKKSRRTPRLTEEPTITSFQQTHDPIQISYASPSDTISQLSASPIHAERRTMVSVVSSASLHQKRLQQLQTQLQESQKENDGM